MPLCSYGFVVQHTSYPPLLTHTFQNYHSRCSAFELNFRILKTHSTERWSRAKWNYASFSEGKRTFDEGKAAKSAGLCSVSQLASSNRGTHRAATKPFASRCQLMGRRIDGSQCVDTAYRIDVIHSVQPNITWYDMIYDMWYDIVYIIPRWYIHVQYNNIIWNAIIQYDTMYYHVIWLITKFSDR